MDKYEFKLKIDEMRALVSARNYHAAAEIAETISWRKIRNLNALVLAGEVFEQVGRYDESKEILLMAYDKSPIGRNIIYRLAEIAIKTQRFDEAQEYYDEFVDIAPHDNLKFVLKYKMTAAQGLPYKEQIRILEELKEQEYSEEWAYELAYLYHRDMQPEKCVEACDELILWFGDGIYVEKALELKMHYQPLSKQQEEKYRMFRQKRTGVIEVTPNKVPQSKETAPTEINAGSYDTQNLQEEIARGMQQISEVKQRRQGLGRKMVNLAGINRKKDIREPQEPANEMQSQYEEMQGMQNQYEEMQGMQNQYEEMQGMQNQYEKMQGMQNPHGVVQRQQDGYAAPQGFENQNAFSQEYQGADTAPQEPVNEMTFEEIQAEWERTKQAMQDALQEAEEQEQESSKERSLEEAEQLMQRLLSIIPLLTQNTASKEAAGQEMEIEDGQPVQIQEDLEQAGRIVAGMNQILQDQIDRLIAEERQAEQQEQEPVIHTVSDPTRELPRLPEEMIEGIENGAAEKIEMDGNSLEKDSVEVDNPVMSAYKEAVQPGISAIDLLQRVRMGKTGADAVPQQVQRTNAEEFGGQFQMEASAREDAAIEASAMEAVRQINPEMPETPVMGALPKMRAEVPNMNMAQNVRTEVPDMNTVRNVRTEAPNINAALNMQTEVPNMNAAQNMQTEEMRMNRVQDVWAEEPRMNRVQDTWAEESRMDTMYGMQVEDPGMDAVRNMQEEDPGMDTIRNARTEIPGMEAKQNVRAEIPGMETAQNARAEIPGMNTVQNVRTEIPGMETVQNVQTEISGMEAVQNAQTEIPEMNAVQNARTPEMETTQNRQTQVPEMDFAQNRQTQVPEMDFAQNRQQEIAGKNSYPKAQQMDYIDNMPSEATVQELKQKMQEKMLYAKAGQQAQVQTADKGEVQQTEIPIQYESREGIEQEYIPENRSEQFDRFEGESTQIRQEDLLENKEMNAAPEYGNMPENLVFAARPRFLTQAQLQAESAMDVKKDAQTTKEFSKEAMAAARAAGMYENMGQAEGLDMSEMKTLTPEQKQIFSYFVPIAGMEAQIYDLISGVSEHLQYDKHALSGNIIIEGISGSGKTVLIMDIIKALQKEIKRPSGKTGKIDANVLNQKDLDVLLDKISGGCLIIESAGKISRETAVKLSRCMEQDHTGTLYILEDTQEGIQKALERDSSFASKFTEKISIPLFSLDELVAFGKAYANDLDYEIDEMGVLALYKRVGNIQKLDHVTTLTEVKEIVDEAIDNAEKGVLKKVFGILTATRANDDNYVILREKDFEE